jgi:hypothetical protein
MNRNQLLLLAVIALSTAVAGCNKKEEPVVANPEIPLNTASPATGVVDPRTHTPSEVRKSIGIDSPSQPAPDAPRSR